MNPFFAVFIYFICLLFVLYFDGRRNADVSITIWIPLVWFLIIGSRNLSQWLSGNPVSTSADVYLEGSAADRAVFLILIAVGLFILYKRRVQWRQLIENNRLIFAFVLYCGISILWSDLPMVSLKRWIKGTGDYVMVLVILTEAFPIESIKAVIRKSAYILIPGSIIMMKYFEGGRIFTPWGQSEYVGVATSKNMLGTLYLIFGIYFFWSLFWKNYRKGMGSDGEELFLQMAYLAMISWLYLKAPSLTSLLCLITGVLLMVGLRRPFIRNNPKRIGIFFFFLVFALIMLQTMLNWIPGLIALFGRDPSLTGRIPLWEDLLSIKINPLLGAGYEIFWIGDRLEYIWEGNWWRPNQAHNGFIEIYLNLGWIGLGLVLGILYSTYRKIIKQMKVDYEFGSFRMTILSVMLLYSQTEAAFKGLHKMWFLFLLIAMEYRGNLKQVELGT